MKFPYRQISRFTFRYYWLIILSSVLLTILSIYKVSDLQFKGDFVDLLPSDFASVQGLNEIKKRAGGEGYLVIVLETDRVEQAKAFAEALVPKLKTFEEMYYIDYKFDKKFFEDRNLLYIEKNDLITLQSRLQKKIETERNRLNPFYIDLLEEKYEFNIADIKEKYSSAQIKDYYLTEKPKRLVILMKPTGFASNLEFCKRLLSKTKTTVASLNPDTFDPSMKIRYTGRYVTRIEETEFMFEDLRRMSIFAIIGVFLLLLLFARHTLSILFIGIPLIFSIVYALAFTTLTIGYLNVVTSVMVAILSGMGIDFGIHLYWRYREERGKGVPLDRAIEIIHEMTGKPVAMAALTTAAAFYALTPSKFIGFYQFGWIAGSGIIISLITAYFLLPALLILREKISPLKSKPFLTQTDPAIDFIKFPKKYPKPALTIACFVLFSLFSLWSLFKLTFDYDFRKFSADKYGTLALQEEISDAFGIALTPSIVYADRQEDLPILTKNLNAIRDHTPNSTIQKGLSLFSYVPDHQDEKIPEIRKLGEIAHDKILRFLEGEEAKNIEDLRRWATIEPFGVKDLPPHLQQQYNAVNGYPGSFLFIFPAIDLWHGKDVVRFANELRIFSEQNKQHNIHLASEALIFSDILTLVKKEGPIALAISFMAILFFIWLDIRNWKRVFLVFSPLCLAMLSLAGIMNLFGIKLNFMNTIVFPILLGLGIDNSVHLYHRYKEAGPGSLLFVLEKTGGAVFLSMTTTMVGFGGLLIAYHRGLNSMGLLAVVGLGLCLLTSFTFFPAILQILENRSEKQKILSLPSSPQKNIKRLAS